MLATDIKIKNSLFHLTESLVTTFEYPRFMSNVICVRLRTEPKNFEKLECKKSIFLVYGKMLVIQFPYMINY